MLKSFRQGVSALQNSTSGISSPADFEDLVLYVDSQEFANITFASGSGDGDPVDSVAGVGDALGVIDDSNGSYYFEYVASGIHGKPAFRKGGTRGAFVDENEGSPALYDATVTLVYFFTGIFDGTQDDGFIAAMDSSSALVRANSSTEMQYEDAPLTTPVTISGTYDLEELTMVALSYQSTSILDVKVNDQSFQRLDPNDNYISSPSVKLGNRNALGNGLYHEFYGAMVYDRALTNDELNQLYEWGVARYGS